VSEGNRQADRSRGGSTRCRLGLISALLCLLGLSAFYVADAGAYYGINTFEVETSSTQAGGHPDVSMHYTWDARYFKEGEFVEVQPGTCGCEDAETIDTHFPAGFIGNPHAVPECTLNEFANRTCPSAAQVGVVGFFQFLQQPLYNMEPHPGQPGLLAFGMPILGAPVFIELHGRTSSDYGLDATTVGIFHILALSSTDIYLWGVPAAASHDPSRQPSPQTNCFGGYPEPCPGHVPSTAAPAPYLENPTSCGTALSSALDIYYYDNVSAHAEALWPSTTGCDQLDFNPNLTAKPTTTEADTAAGLDVDLHVPQTQSPTVPSPSEIKGVTVTLPKGFSINPNTADGKSVCTDAEAAFGTEDEARCPETAKVGTERLDTSALPAPIDGAIYLGEPQPGNPYRLILTADGFSTHVKLAGIVHADEKTGQISVTFPNLPQSPFQDFNMHFFGSERGLLATPTQCGNYAVETDFVPWDEVLPNQHSTSFFTIDSGPNGQPCPPEPRNFQPTVVAGSVDNTAGAYSAFGLEVSRPDGDQNMESIDVRTPPGLLAKIAGVSYCPESAIAQLSSAGYTGVAEQTAPACPAASQIGTTTAGVGAGSHPLYLPGRVYLAGPYKGAPLSLVVVVPAVSASYDLGNVMVRAAVNVDPITAHVSTVSDRIPSIIGGIPLRLRFVQVHLDRPSFMINPTNCDPFSIAVSVFGSEGAVAGGSPPYQVANCADLAYGPKLSLRLAGGVNRRGHPAIHAVVTEGAREANTRTVSVTLPKGEQLDNSHFGKICTRVDFVREACPPDSAIGEAQVTTPLLDRPLAGPVFLRSSTHRLPDIVIDLKGQLELQLDGRVDAVKGRLRTTFESVPDAPFETFELDLAGGSKGLVTNSEGLCGIVKRAAVTMTGQNGVSYRSQPKVAASCGKAARHKRHRARKAASR
jgi:hypothetical protein